MATEVDSEIRDISVELQQIDSLQRDLAELNAKRQAIQARLEEKRAKIRDLLDDIKGKLNEPSTKAP